MKVEDLPVDSPQPTGPSAKTWEWQLQAACRSVDPAGFFHPPGERRGARARRIEAAKAICQDCPARIACLDHALRTREPYGIWGGHSEDERAELLGLRSLRYPQRRDPQSEQLGRDRSGRPAAHKDRSDSSLT